ncbi:glycosyltransferase family protein [Algoriphagus sp. CAU 1675]|uniref:glycosyltransferase family protein n=1 Tax=Algoriphagus sp. CAU 1675 TaxID=3032597 RepID=UPI0023D9CD2A|nr:glycosyltransferase family protein [Algoriphagus sp. CAU 1675]MDF2157180.1 glycosyltransferase family protein [Algoriphagus sp. CAU 1675]
MKFLFIIQGEGRGHMTQAIAFSRLLKEQGHELCSVILGKSKRREVPAFFTREILAPIHLVSSPNFETDSTETAILLGKTIQKNLCALPVFWKSLEKIHQIVNRERPDIILNFYDLLGGFYNFLFRPRAAYWVIGHQYLIEHPSFPFAPSKGLEKTFFQLNTRLTALGADRKLALSFLPQKNPVNSIQIVPPLLRREVKNQEIKQGDFFLAYIVNPGYGAQILNYAQANPHIKIKVYWDKKGATEVEQPLKNLSFHRVHDQNFLKDMASCKGLVCTAGFESVCEAMYLGKPTLVIPVAGQYEQACNALEIQQKKIGIASTEFDFSLLEKIPLEETKTPQEFIHWQNSWGEILQNLLTKGEVFWDSTAPSLEMG